MFAHEPGGRRHTLTEDGNRRATGTNRKTYHNNVAYALGPGHFSTLASSTRAESVPLHENAATGRRENVGLTALDGPLGNWEAGSAAPGGKGSLHRTRKSCSSQPATQPAYPGVTAWRPMEREDMSRPVTAGCGYRDDAYCKSMVESNDRRAVANEFTDATDGLEEGGGGGANDDRTEAEGNASSSTGDDMEGSPGRQQRCKMRRTAWTCRGKNGKITNAPSN